jgi:3-(3-hydroxy-phenyl)propionate hydroxylase
VTLRGASCGAAVCAIFGNFCWLTSELKMRASDRILIAGAGPIGMVAAAALVRRGVPVAIFEAGSALATESRASTFHPPTLDMLDQLGVAQKLVALGRIAPTVQYRTREELLAEFDFKEISDVTRHPFRLQCEQFKLTQIILNELENQKDFSIHFDSEVLSCRQSDDLVYLTVKTPTGIEEVGGRYLVAADGASSAVRRSLNIEFEGFTWPDRFLVVSTPFDFKSKIEGLSSVSYVADPDRWHFYLQIPTMWRIMFPVCAEVSDDEARSDQNVRRQMETLIPGVTNYNILHVTLYKVHQRVAKTYRQGRAFLAGDAAHINNPLGGMGMNGGIHDAINLSDCLAAVWHGESPDDYLDRYDSQRRLVTIEFVQRQTIQNKQNLEAKSQSAFDSYKERMRSMMKVSTLRRKHLLDISMISSLNRAKELS